MKKINGATCIVCFVIIGGIVNGLIKENHDRKVK